MMIIINYLLMIIINNLLMIINNYLLMIIINYLLMIINNLMMINNARDPGTGPTGVLLIMREIINSEQEIPGPSSYAAREY